MGYLKIVVTLLVLPPINLVLLALVGLVLARYRPRAGRTVTAIALVGLLALSMHAVTTPMLITLERDLPMRAPIDAPIDAPPGTPPGTPPGAPPGAAPGAPPGAIVILSGDSQASPGGYTVGGITLRRLLAGASLHRGTGLPILVSGGPVPHHAPPLAELMAQTLRLDFRVEVRWLEFRSLDTAENARFSAEILREAGISSVYLVTDAWHMPRALLAFGRTGLRVAPAPTPLRPPPAFTLTDFVPSVASWTTAHIAAREWVGLLWYAIR